MPSRYDSITAASERFRPDAGDRRLDTYGRVVLRTALRPRWLALLALVGVVVAAFVWLGSWQLGVARDRGAEQALREARAMPPVPIDDVLPPQRAFTAEADSREVVVRGTYDASGTLLVTERVQPMAQAGTVPPSVPRSGDGVIGWWVITPLRTGGGAWLPVVRGWVATPQDAAAVPAAVPTGQVTVHGVLQPDEPPSESAAALPSGQLGSVDVADLVNRWGTPIYNGFVVLTAEQGGAPGIEAARPHLVPAPQPHPGGIAWRNAAYAVQWWVFAGFAVVMWWRMVQQAARDEQSQVNYGQGGDSSPSDDGPAPPPTSSSESAPPERALSE